MGALTPYARHLMTIRRGCVAVRPRAQWLRTFGKDTGTTSAGQLRTCPTGYHLGCAKDEFDLCQGNRAPSCTTSAIYGVPFSLGQPYGRPRVDSGPDVVAK